MSVVETGNAVGAPDPVRLGPDVERRRGLRRMKLIATGALVIAAVIYLACVLAQRSADSQAWVGYVRATVEAAMVGALADWFAVTALFRHPLGIPIPHTAIVKRKKDQLGDSLSAFVRENFLTADVVAAKVESAQLTLRVAQWLEQPANSERVAAELASGLSAAIEFLRDDEIAAVVDATLKRRIAEPMWGPPIGRLLDVVISEGRHQPVIALLCERAHEWAVNAGPTIERIVTTDSPGWTPKFVDLLVGDRIHRELIDFTDKIRRDPDHELRKSADRFLSEFADDLQHDPATMARAESLKEQLTSRAEIAEAADALWRTAKRLIAEAVDDPASPLRTKMTETLMRLAHAGTTDAALRAKGEYWIGRTVRHITERYGREATAIIADTIRRWDADSASRRFELQVGRDLQFIRINGTLVGSLAGFVIYAVTQLIG